MARIRPSRLRILIAGFKIRIGFTNKSNFQKMFEHVEKSRFSTWAWVLSRSGGRFPTWDNRRGEEDKKGHPRLMTPEGVGGLTLIRLGCFPAGPHGDRSNCLTTLSEWASHSQQAFRPVVHGHFQQASQQARQQAGRPASQPNKRS